MGICVTFQILPKKRASIKNLVSDYICDGKKKHVIIILAVLEGFF